MLLSKLIENTGFKLVNTDGDIDVARIEYDSRRVKPGEMFACVVGTFKDGHDFAGGAVANGASVLLVERELPFTVPQVIAPNSRRAMAQLAEKLYGYPAKELRMIGVTGTNGKTTTTYMVKSIAEKCGLKVGLIGTIRNIIGDRVISTQRTTPESTELQKILRMMADEGVDLVVMEVSSHSLDQERVYGIDFEIGGFTNLTQDHLDYHKTFDNYLAAKKKLFERSAFAVVNADDPYSEKLLEGLSVPRMTYAVREPADIYANDIEICVRDVEFDMTTPEGSAHIAVPIPGLFNVFNAMLAAGICLRLGFPIEKIAEGLSDVSGVTGRMEALPTEGFPFSVILDFAHTPDGLINLLTSVREFAKGRVISVFGCGGDRDHAKRPIMGEAAGRYSDFCVVTSDNPRTEDPMAIIGNVLDGVNKTAVEYVVIQNRREAIRYALTHARPDDVVVLAGKGHETYQEIMNVKYPFDEKVVVAELLDEMRRGEK
ncbi:MAG: UDP-N-acetylmuramoyl-L-alanyl-D-glutamate--2,6-diaminopimelate ligase [Clostridia bacterium]|nr:UDP-N-acetylmuramoyl-L-alanyl-D-glutamate--2,6-diaminopimelate ligase [Clostridia bacterium]